MARVRADEETERTGERIHQTGSSGEVYRGESERNESEVEVGGEEDARVPVRVGDVEDSRGERFRGRERECVRTQ